MDLHALQNIAEEQKALAKSGKWDRAAFDRLLAEASKAAGDHPEMLEFLFNEAQAEWLLSYR